MKTTVTLPYCPLCRAPLAEPYLQCKDYTVTGETFQIVRCRKCSFLFTNPRPAEADLPKYYASDAYISHTEAKKGLISHIYLFARKSALKRKRILLDKLAPPGTLLDFGCGTGAFLSEIEKSGRKGIGVEPDEGARMLAAGRVKGSILSPEKINSLPPASFAAITLWHVLEHIADPLEHCRTFHRLLQDDGILVLALPNPESTDARYYKQHWAAWDVPRHLNHFTQADISTLGGMAGFGRMEVRPMPLDAFYISWLSEKYKGSGLLAPLLGFVQGFRSNLMASRRGTSSLLYILRKQ